MLMVLSLPLVAVETAPLPLPKPPAAAHASALVFSSVSVVIMILPSSEVNVTLSPRSILVEPILLALATDTPTATPPNEPDQA